MSNFMSFTYIGNNADDFFYSLSASMAVLFFLLSAGVTVIKGK